jgi:hypothetical protein
MRIGDARPTEFSERVEGAPRGLLRRAATPSSSTRWRALLVARRGACDARGVLRHRNESRVLGGKVRYALE